MTKRKKVNLVFNVILSVLSLAAFIFFAIFAVEFLVAANNEDNLGKGIGMAVCLVIMIICDAAMGVIMVIGGIWSFAVRKLFDGRAKKLITAMGIFDISSFATASIVTAVLLILNNTGAF